MKKILIPFLIALCILITNCKEENPIDPVIEMYSFSGRVFSIVESEKIYMESVMVILNSDTTISDTSGIFRFEDVPSGKHQIIFNFDSYESYPYLSTKVDEVNINSKDSLIEFFIHEQGIFEGRVFTILEEEKKYLENVEVNLMNDTAYSDSVGKFKLRYDYSFFKDKKANINFIYTDDYLENQEDILIENNYHFQEFLISPKVSLALELYKMLGIEKKNILDALPKLNGIEPDYSTNGLYFWENLRIGTYNFNLDYPGCYSIQESISLNKIENNFSYELKLIGAEDLIFVADQNFYFINSKGESFQITYTNERIANEVKFFKDRNRFVYVSAIGESHYSINLINLNPLFHKVIYEAEVGITQPRISPNEGKVYFLENTRSDDYDKRYWGVKSVDLTTKEISSFEKEFYEPLLFHDCNRVAYTDRPSQFDFRYTYIYNIQNEDSLLINEIHNEKGGGHKSISNNDRFILFNYSYDAIPITFIYDIELNSVPSFSATDIDDGYGMGKFTEYNLKYYGILSNIYEERPYQSVMIDVNTEEKTVLGEGFEQFTMLSYSIKNNIYMYSVSKDGNGDIKIYDANADKHYDFITTSANEYNGIFVNK